jgi:hypothetical protein
MGRPVVIIWDTEAQFRAATIPPNELLLMTHMGAFEFAIPYQIFGIINKFAPVSRPRVPVINDEWV